MGFSADSVEGLWYDFSKWGGPDRTDIPEPSSVQIASFWGAYEDMMRAYRAELDKFQVRLAEVRENDDLDTHAKIEAAEPIEAEFREWQKTAAPNRLNERKVLVANLCSGEPNFEILDALPGRVYDKFETYIMEEVSPLGLAAATS